METIYSAIKFQNENGRFIPYLNEEFKNKLINSKNPKIVMVIGKAREGKSTALNHLLFDKTLDIPKKLRKISSPFPSKGGENAITKEFLFYGPIKASELCRRNKIEFEEEDFDYFFVDTEGIENFYKMSEILYQGVFSLESITSCILFVSKGTIDEEGILYISRHIQASKLLNSTSDNSFPGLAVISRDVGIEDEDDYDSDDEIILNKLDSIRINQDNLKLNEIKERLNINTGIIFSEDNLKYLAEPHFETPKLYLNSIRDLCMFIINNTKNQSSKNSKEIFDKFDQHQEFISKYPELLNTNVPMEETIKNIFSVELQEIENRIIREDGNLVINKINSLNLQDMSNIQKESYINDILIKIEKKFEDETNSRYQGMKRIIEEQYNLALSELKDHFRPLIESEIDKKMEWFVEQMKSYIETAKNESKIDIENSIINNIEKLTLEELRKLDKEDYINNNYEVEIKKFKEKANSLFKNIENIPQTKDFYTLNLVNVNEFIKPKIEEKLNNKFKSQPVWPKNIYELLQEQKINILETGKQYTLYLNKKPYYVIARNDGKVKIPDIKINQNYRYEQLECWKGQVLYDSWDKEIDYWFEPENQLLMLSDNNVNQFNWGEGGHISFFGRLGYPNANKPPRPQQKKTKLSIHIGGPWSIESYGQSGNVNINLSNSNKDMFIETNIDNSSGSINNIKLHLN